MDFTKFDISYMKMAHIWSQNSHCKRKQVGALIVKDKSIISDGFNGTPSGMDNCCEDGDGETKWDVIHAESNAICKLAKSHNSAEGSTLYITLSPCRECSKLILQAGIKRLIYGRQHSDTSGIEMLKSQGIEVLQLELNDKNIYDGTI